MFGKTKKITASDILKMIADLPDEERDAVRSMLNNDSSEVEEQESESSEVATEEGAAEEATETDATETDSAEEDTGEATDAPEGEQEPEDAETVEETVEGFVEEAAETEDAEEDAEEATETAHTDFEEIREAIRSLAQRVDALTERMDSGSSSDEDIGQPFGPDITEKSKNENDDLERARRAAFGF